jgi:hypothetical protein
VTLVSVYSLFYCRTKHHPERKSVFETHHSGDIIRCPTASFPFLPISVFVVTMANNHDTVLNFWSPKGALLGRFNSNEVENYDVTVADDAKFVAVSTWYHEVKLWHCVQAAGSLSAVSKVMSLTAHTVRVCGPTCQVWIPTCVRVLRRP